MFSFLINEVASYHLPLLCSGVLFGTACCLNTSGIFMAELIFALYIIETEWCLSPTDFFHVPEVGELFDEVQFVEQSEEDAKKTVEGYHREGKRQRDRGEEPQHNKRQRYDHDRRDGRYGGRRDGGKYGMFMCLVCARL